MKTNGVLDLEYEDKWITICFNAQLYFLYCKPEKEALVKMKKMVLIDIITNTTTKLSTTTTATRSEKEALRRRKKRTPTVAMTTEQYKAKRGILLSTPKKAGLP